MNLWRSLRGTVEVKLVSADIPGLLELLRNQGIELFEIRFEDYLTVTATVPRQCYGTLRKMVEKRGDTVTLQHRGGLYWAAKGAVQRPLLLWGMIFLLSLCLYLPTRVLFVRVEGNQTLPSRMILAAAEDCGIRFGASRREVRSERMKNSLLGEVPGLQWAGVNTYGCVAVISVRERAETAPHEERKEVSSLVASRDGVIVSCTVTDGSACCTVGQVVKEGQILISGYTDCGILLQATRAEGEIIAQTRRKFQAVTLPKGLQRQNVREVKRNYSLLLGKKRINLWNSSGICGATCGRMYEEYYITLPGGFSLPVALAVETVTSYDCVEYQKESEEAYQALTSFCEGYVKDQMISGSILESDYTAQTGAEGYALEADYLCLEMIGKRRQEGNGEINGKSD